MSGNIRISGLETSPTMNLSNQLIWVDACLPSSLRLDSIRYLSMLDKVFDIALSSNTISMNKVVKKIEIKSGVSATNEIAIDILRAFISSFLVCKTYYFLHLLPLNFTEFLVINEFCNGRIFTTHLAVFILAEFHSIESHC